LEIGQRAHASWNALELYALAAEQDGARFASAEEFALRYFDQVRMIGTQTCAAQLAAFERLLAPRELAQRSKAIGRFGELP